MKKTRKLCGVALIFVILVFATVVVVQAAVQTASSTGIIKTTFSSSESVYVRSTTDLCNGAFDKIDLYVVESGITDLNDVRENFQEITLTENYAISRVEIWETPIIGDYNVLIDCDQDGNYNLLEPKTSFKIAADKGKASASVGENNPGNHTWKYDSEDINLINEMLQISLLAAGENVELKNMTIMLKGSEGETDINKVEVYVDSNGNGKLDGDEDLIGDFDAEAPINNNGKVTVLLDYSLLDGETENILVIYKMRESETQGILSLEVSSIIGVGENSESILKFSGTPIVSNTKTILPPKTCLGELTIELDSGSVMEDSEVVVEISNLEGCQNKRISLRTNPCNSKVGEEVGFCISGDTGCQLIVKATEDKTYYACIDKNSDSDMLDFGESASVDLMVEKETGELEEEETETMVTEEELEEEAEDVEITGAASAIGGLKDNLLGAAGGFLILLEITLLLILFVLVMILFKLKGSSDEDDE